MDLPMERMIPYQNLYVYEISGEISNSNLHFQVIEPLTHQKSFFEKRWVILSGIFVKDAEEIERRLNQTGIQTLRKYQEKIWLTWVGMKTG
jgi:ribosomal protein L11 methylase PrmA